MVTATLVLLAIVLIAGVGLLAVTVRQRRLAGRTEPAGLPGLAGPGGSARPQPGLGTPAQVWLAHGEKVGARLRALAAEHPLFVGAGADAEAVIMELRSAASDVAALDQARAGVTVTGLQAQQQRLDADISAAAGTPAEADLRAARDSVTARLETATAQRAAKDALLARMRAAVAGLEAAETELTGLLADPVRSTNEATAQLTDRLGGLRAGLAEVRALSNPQGQHRPPAGTGQGEPGDIPGQVEPPPRN